MTVHLDTGEERELRRQMVDAFQGADYPVNSPMDLVPALPDGPGTTFESGDLSMTAMELNTKLGGGDFPYDSAEEFVDDVMERLADQGHVRTAEDSPFDTDDDVYDTEPATTGTGTEVYGEADSGGGATPEGEDVNFCTDCGADLTDRTVTTYCPVCGFELG